ncbi:MAG: hypothetical protein H6Q67_1812 [Firmicutes bacterium]|nr:hypothetical protein [Bacillota bacterium]
MKKLLLTLAALTLMTSVAVAAPIMDLQKDQVVAGYNYWSPDLKEGSHTEANALTFNGLYLATALDKNIIIGLDYSTANLGSANFYDLHFSSDYNMIDLNINYKVNKNIQLIAGNRNYSNTVTVSTSSGYSSSDDISSMNKIFYGAGITLDLGTAKKPSNLYASILHSDIFTDKQVGVNLGLNKNIALNINYRQYNEDNYTLESTGGGISYRF